MRVLRVLVATVVAMVCSVQSWGQCTTPPNITVTHVNSCPGAQNGTITVTVTSGDTPDLIRLVDGGIEYNPTAGVPITVDNGTYTVTTECNSGTVTGWGTVTVSDFATMVLNVPATHFGCYGADLTLNASVTSGGVAPFTYAWTNPATNPVPGGVITNATPANDGTYNLIVTDNAGCTAPGSTTVTIGASAVVATANYDSTYCHGATVALAGSATGGSTVYTTYAWYGPGGYTSALQNPEITNATAANSGVYKLLVTDDNNCVSDTATATVVVTTPVVAAAQADDTYCNGVTINLGASASGGTASYTYSWVNADGDPVTGGQIANATAADNGNYIVTATDANGCTDTDTTNITVLPALSVTVPVDSTYCPGVNFTLHSSATGGSGSYVTYAWTGPSGYSSNVQNAVVTAPDAGDAGPYLLLVTDNEGCQGSATTVVSIATAVVATAEYDSTYCHHATVALAGSATGGSGTYTYAWSGPGGYTSTNQAPEIMNATAANSGAYSLVVTDDNSCVSAAATATVVVTSPVVAVAQNDTTYCNGITTTLGASASGGTGPYTYTWENAGGDPVANGDLASVTPAESGNYIVTATDANGCTDTDTTAVVVLSAVAVTVPVDSTYCFGVNITLPSSATGGSGTYSSYSWSGPGGYTSSAQNAPITSTEAADAGAYTVTITDNNGCTGSASTIIAIATPVVATAEYDSTYCHHATVALAGSATGGSGTYTYAWSGPGGYTSTDQNPEIMNATAANSGTYSLVVTDDNSCVSTAATASVVVTAPVVVVAQNDTTYCYGVTTNLGASASGGTGPYTYAWENAGGDPIANGELAAVTAAEAGNYIVTVTDANGCTDVDTTAVAVAPAIVVSVGTDTTYCNGATINLNSSVSGGSGVYTSFAWSGPNGFSSTQEDPQVTTNATPAMNGTYELIVTDNAGCTSASTSLVITVNTAIIAVAQYDSTYCYGATVALAGDASGGAGSYTYAWSGPASFSSVDQNTEILNATPANGGHYILTVTDEDGCVGVPDTATVVVHTAINVVAANDTTYCHLANITLLASASGGTAPYTKAWVNSSEDPIPGGTITGATITESGDYAVTVTDANGCTGFDTTTVTVLTPVTVIASEDTIYCSGATIALTADGDGGSGTYVSYAWYGPASFTSTSQNPQITNANAAKAGEYKVIVTDNLGCKSDSESVAIAVYDPLVVTASNNGLCHGDDLTLSSNLSGGTGDLTYAWTGPGGYTSADEIPVITGADAGDNGVYSLTITDEKGCVSNTANTTVNISTPVVATDVENNASCHGTTITLSATGDGGTAPYTYAWANADGDPIAGGLVLNPDADDAGDYTVKVTDDNGCESGDYTTTVAFYETPSTEATNFQVLTIASDSLVVSFDRGNGDGVIVLVSEGAPANTLPGCGAVYNTQENAAIGLNDAGLSSLGNAKVIYNSLQSPSTVEIALTGLDFNTQYYFTVYEYDTSADGTAYLLDPNLTGDEFTAHAPTGVASNLRFDDIDNTSLTATWTNGNGAGRIVVLQVNDSFLTGGTPVDGVDYDANATPGMGDSLGTGIYVIYKGTDSTIDLTGLNVFGLYTVGVYEYNGTGASIKYSAEAAAKAVRTSATVSSVVSKYTIQINFTSPGADRGVLVLMKQGSAMTATPTNGVEYLSSTQKNVSFNTSTIPQVGDAYAVYRNRNRDGDANPAYYTLNMMDLMSDVNYYFEVYEWDTLTNNYTYHPELAFNAKTVLGSPNQGSKNLAIENLTANSLKLKWTNGNGARRMVLMKVKTGSNVVMATTTDSVTYAANSVFGMGDTVVSGNAGTNYVVYNGSDSSVTITGLSGLTTYNLAVIDYNGADGFENYRANFNRIDATTAGIKLTNVTPKKATITFAHGNGRGAVILVKEGSAITTDPTNGTDYAAPTYQTAPTTPPTVSFNGALPVIDGAKMIYRNPKGSPSIKSVTIGDLKPATDYYIVAYEWDTLTNTYYPATKLAIDTTTGLAAPTQLAKNFVFEDVTANSFKVKWTNGNGNNRIVAVKAVTAVNGTVQNNTVYVADADFGQGDTLAIPSGTGNVARNYVVYNGNDSSVTVTNLLANTTYYVKVFEYNGTTTNMYGNGSAPATTKTLMDFVTMKKEGQAYLQDFDSLAIVSSLPAGWHSSDASVTDNTGADGTDGVYSFGGGDYSAADRSLGSIGNNTFGVKLMNKSTKTITSLMIRYRGIQWRKGGASTPSSKDRLIVQFSTDAYTMTDPNQYLSSTPATWTEGIDNTWNNNDNIDFFSLSTGAGAASLNVAGSLPTQQRGASITGLNLAPGQAIWIRFNDLDLTGNDDALAVDSFEVIMFSNTIVGGGSVSTGTVSDLNIVGGSTTQDVGTVTVTNSMNIENDATYDMTAGSARTLKVSGRLYTDNELGHGEFATGILSSLNINGNEGENNLNFSATNNTMRNLSVTGGANAHIHSAVNIRGGAQFGTVAVGTSSLSSTLHTNGFLTLKSDTLGTATISAIYGSVTGAVTVERAMTYKAGNRLMGHPFNTNISLSQVNDDVAVDVSGTSTQNVWSFSPSTTTATQAAHLVNSAVWKEYSSATGNWKLMEVLRLAKGTGAVTLDATGTINQGQKTVTLTGAVGSLHVVTNPYPSAVKLANVLGGATGIVDTVWTYNLNTNTFKANLHSQWSALNLPMCGVMVVKLSSTTATMVFNEANKVTSTSTASFFRPEDGVIADDETLETGVELETVATALQISLAPNPADDVVNVRINGGEDSKATVRILSMTGQLMSTTEVESIQNSQITIPVGSLTKGIYIVEVTTDTERITQQLMKL